MPDPRASGHRQGGRRERRRTDPPRRDRLGEALRGLGIGRSGRPRPPAEADVSTRLAALEREVQEVRTRINALFFAVLAAALGELVGRLVLA